MVFTNLPHMESIITNLVRVQFLHSKTHQLKFNIFSCVGDLLLKGQIFCQRWKLIHLSCQTGKLEGKVKLFTKFISVVLIYPLFYTKCYISDRVSHILVKSLGQKIIRLLEWIRLRAGHRYKTLVSWVWRI
jgi:hypothetical protein